LAGSGAAAPLRFGLSSKIAIALGFGMVIGILEKQSLPSGKLLTLQTYVFAPSIDSSLGHMDWTYFFALWIHLPKPLKMLG
jgi:hypothetical protein